MTPRTSGTDRKATRRKAAARPTTTRSAKPRPAARDKTAPAKAETTDRTGTAKTAAAKRRTSPADVGIDDDVLEFIDALDRFKKAHNKPFPSWSEVLHVLRGLGYRKAR